MKDDVYKTFVFRKQYLEIWAYKFHVFRNHNDCHLDKSLVMQSVLLRKANVHNSRMHFIIIDQTRLLQQQKQKLAITEVLSRHGPSIRFIKF